MSPVGSASPGCPEPRVVEESEAYLQSLIREGIKYGLEHFGRLLDAADHPERAVPWVHVAGTNGKGSTSAMIEAILRAQGHRTVLFTSPHLVSPRERFRVDGLPAKDGPFTEAVHSLRRTAEAVVAAGHELPTFFEACTFLIMQLAWTNGEGWGVAEAGLGGRLDATNLLVPECTLITSIGLDHTKTLGASLEAIAAEKAGIAKPGVPLLVPPLADSVLARIREIAGERGGEVEVLDVRVDAATAEPSRVERFSLVTSAREYPDLELPLTGAHQRRNAAMAVRSVELALFRRGESLDPDAVRRGLASVHWPARFDIREGDPLVVLDAVHNPQGMAAFHETWKRTFGRQPAAVLFGVCSDKNLGEMFAPLSEIAVDLTFAAAAVKRALPCDQLLEKWRRYQGDGCPARGLADLAGAWDHARARARDLGVPLIVCGSLYLLGDVMALPDGPSVEPPSSSRSSCR